MSANTWRLAIAIAEVFVGQRPIGDQTGHHARRGEKVNKGDDTRRRLSHPSEPKGRTP